MAVLLQTKLYLPPARADRIARPRLIARLDQGIRRGCKLTLLYAPAGAGKTTLVSQWLTSRSYALRVKAWFKKDQNELTVRNRSLQKTTLVCMVDVLYKPYHQGGTNGSHSS